MRRNFGLKLLSLFIAIVLGIFVHSENNVSSARVLIPIEIRDLPQDKVVVWQQRKQAEIEVRGPAFLIARISSAPPVLKLRIPSDVAGRFTADLRAAELDIQSPVQVLGVEPATVDFSFEKRLTRVLPVKLLKEGSLPPDLKFNSVEILPSEVTVSGPESELKDYHEITTEPLDLSAVKKPTQRDLFLRIPGRLTETSTSSVQVSIGITAIPIKKEFRNLAVEIRSSREGVPVVVEPHNVTVTLSGEKDVLTQLKDEDVTPYVKVDGGESSQVVKVDLPSDSSLVSVSPAEVKIVKRSVSEGSKKGR